MPEIVIIGAGIGGVAFGIALRRQLRCNDFVIYEKASEIGGTWRDNIYPGASSDIGVHFYSLSTDLNPDWPSTHGSQQQTQDYWRKLTAKYDLYRNIVFNRRVVSAEWSGKEQLYTIISEDITSGTSIPKHRRGLFLQGRDVPLRALGYRVELRGKRVAVIGNGASATQFVPIISQDPTVQITEFCRTPNWFLPPPSVEVDIQNIPLAMRVHRFHLYLRSELLYLFVFAHKAIRSRYSVVAKDYIMKTAPEEELEHLVPSYDLGCKRMIFDTNFLAALHRPNLSLNWDGIESIVEDGIITQKGEKLPFDVIIFATGFTADRYALTVVGPEGKTVQDYYDSQGGPKAYLGTTVPGFPNLFMIGGPNTATGHTSFFLTEEIQINHIIKFVKPILDGLVSTFSVTTRATETYNEIIQARLARSVFVGCVSWYRSGGEGKVSSIFPGPMFLYQWWMRRPQWADYDVQGTEQWKSKLRRERWIRWINPAHYLALVLGLLVSLIGW